LCLALAHFPVPQQHLGNLVPDLEGRVERGHRLLENHRQLVAAQVAQARRPLFQQVFTVEQHFAAGDAARRLRDEPHDGEGGDALAAAGFADDAERAAFLELEVDPVHRSHLAALRSEVRAQAAYLKQAFCAVQSVAR
jgi:hypothetical protein